MNSKIVSNIMQRTSKNSSSSSSGSNDNKSTAKCPFEKPPKQCIEMTENLDINSISSNSSLQLPKCESAKQLSKIKLEKDNNSYFSSDNEKEFKQPLITKEAEGIPIFNQNRYIIEKYDENCNFESKIEYIECLIEDERKNFMYFFLSIITLGIYSLLLEIFTLIKVKTCYLKTGIANARYFLIKCNDGNYYIQKAYHINLPLLTNCNIINFTNIPISATETKFFEFKFYKYIYNPRTRNFISLKFNLNANYDVISRKMKCGLTEDELEYQKIFIYKDKNAQNIKPITDIIMTELSNPFYLVLLICIIIFILEEYSLYWKVLTFGTIIILFYTLIETQSFIYSINKLLSAKCKINVLRKNISVQINSDDLVPGDVLILPENDFVLPCDLLLLNGSAIVNECFLSGESNPVFKTRIPKNGDKFDKSEKKYILYSGTKILQAKNEAIGLVIGVGFDTEKGKLIRSILFKENNKELYIKNKENNKVIMYLLLIFVLGFLLCIRIMIKMDLSFFKIIYLGSSLLVEILPCSITISITIGIYISFIRLQKSGISCLDRNKIDIAGKIDVMCFDKTGTLTEDHVETYGYRAISMGKKGLVFGSFIDDIEDMVQDSFAKFIDNNLNNNKSSNSKNQIKENSNSTLQASDNIKENNAGFEYSTTLGDDLKDRIALIKQFFVEALISCNCLTKIKGTILGDPIDLEMFNSTGWKFEENTNKDPFILGFYHPGEEIIDQYIKKNKDNLNNININKEGENSIYSAYSLGVIRRFEFVYKLQRMSVLIKNAKENYYKLYSKGSPEKIRELCRPETIPSNFNRLLNHYSSQGLRVIALSFKLLKMNFLQTPKLARESVEHDMIFLGFFIVKNKLRPRTKRTINILQEADIKILVSTGDSVFTASSVAKECHIVPEEDVIYSVDITPIKNKDVYELKMKELIVESIDDDDEEEEEESFSDESNDSIEKNIKIKQKFTKMEVESVSEDDLESESYSYEESDIHLIIKKQKEIKLNSLKIPNMKIKLNSCFAITGSAFKILYDLSQRYLKEEKNAENLEYHEMFTKILSKTVIFARMLPEHKTLLIECLKNLNHIVGMCGDGANDIGALHCADIGLSLGVDETSTSAPFISKQQDIKCILDLISEGKACKSNYLSIYKFLLILCIIQFITLIFLINLGSKLSDNQCMLIDICITLPGSIFMSLSKPIKTLTESKALSVDANSLNKTILLHGIIMAIFQILVYEIMLNQEWYNDTYDDTVLFIYSFLQSIICVLVFSINVPFKKGLSKNMLLLLFLISSILFANYLFFAYNESLYKYFRIVEIQNQNFKFLMIIIAIANFFVASYTEKKLFKYEKNKPENIDNNEELDKNKEKDSEKEADKTSE